MPAKLIVTGLGEEVRGEDLYDLFDVYGLIVDVGIDARPRGGVTGFVVYEDGRCAVRARLGMDGAEVNGNRISVLPVVTESETTRQVGRSPESETRREFVHWK